MRLIYLALLLLNACNNSRQNVQAVTPAFYHWKTVLAPAAAEWKVLKENKVNELYVRFFDVSWDNTFNKPLPIAQLRVPDKNIFQQQKINVIPTVFITNECIKNIQPQQCRPLAENIYKLVSHIASVNSIDSVKEIQIDCDWTATTKDKYFSLLSVLQETDTSHLYSATIRLYQVKYVGKTGVPPVKKGLLMAYNMGNLKDPATANSILDPATLKQYTSGLSDYPLPLDVALPLFDWYVLFRNNEYKGLISQIDAGFLQRNSTLQSISNRYQIIRDTVWNNLVLKKDDVLRYENSRFSDLMKAAEIIKKKLSNRSLRLSLYHLDSITLSKYSAHEMEAIFRSFN